MDFFLKASTVRLVSHNDRFLIADKDCITVSHGSDRSAKNAVWIVELVEGKCSVRLKSCYGTYLTASGTRAKEPWGGVWLMKPQKQNFL